MGLLQAVHASRHVDVVEDDPNVLSGFQEGTAGHVSEVVPPRRRGGNERISAISACAVQIRTLEPQTRFSRGRSGAVHFPWGGKSHNWFGSGGTSASDKFKGG